MRAAMRMRGRACGVVAVAAVAAGLTALPALAVGDGALRESGVQVVAPEGWELVDHASAAATAEPRTLLVVGTKGAKAIESPCQVASYRVPAEGAVVVVIGWRDRLEEKPALELSKVRKPTFECFSGRGAVGQVTRRGRDYQVNVMVGDRADAATLADALEVARSFGLAQRKS